MRPTRITLLVVAMLALFVSVARGESIRGSYSLLQFHAEGSEHNISGVYTAYKSGKLKRNDSNSVVCDGYCYANPSVNVLSVGTFGEINVTTILDGAGQPIGVSASWTNQFHSLACYAAAGESIRSCVQRNGEKLDEVLIPEGGLAVPIKGTISTKGCVTSLACDLCEGNDLCVNRTPIAYGQAVFEVVTKYQARRAKGSAGYPPFRSPFSELSPPVQPMPIP